MTIDSVNRFNRDLAFTGRASELPPRTPNERSQAPPYSLRSELQKNMGAARNIVKPPILPIGRRISAYVDGGDSGSLDPSSNPDRIRWCASETEGGVQDALGLPGAGPVDAPSSLVGDDQSTTVWLCSRMNWAT